MTTINRKVSARELRRHLETAVSAAATALENERQLRQRVDAQEQGLELLASVLGRGFLGRLRWLVQGK